MITPQQELSLTELNVQDILSHTLEMQFEKIIFCAFLEDINPQYILLVTYNEIKHTSAIYLYKLVKKSPTDDVLYSPHEHSEEQYK